MTTRDMISRRMREDRNAGVQVIDRMTREEVAGRVLSHDAAACKVLLTQGERGSGRSVWVAYDNSTY